MYQRERLFTRLGFFAYQTFAAATKLCRSYRHEYVELEHWLKVLVDQQKGDIPLLLTHYHVNLRRVNDQLDKILQCMPNRASAVQDLSSRLESAVERGLLMSQVTDGSRSVRTVHVLLGMLQDTSSQRWLYRLSEEFKKIPIPQVADEFAELLKNSVEAPGDDDVETCSTLPSAVKVDDNDILDKWCSDLTQQAKAGTIDPVIGRETELRQMIDILLRRRQNNPILVGEAGVGKTAVVEALARRLVSGEVPPLLKGARLLSLDLGRMQAGAGARGEFESRLKALLDAITHSDCPIILFCDEAHTLVGAGGQAGTGDAVNLLKPMLARGALRMIAATTWSEYKQFIEPDAALTRRFQRVFVSEPDEANAINMLRAIAPYFAEHHGVTIRDRAISAAVRLSLRNLPSRQLPDKAISLLDTACARVALSQHGQPQAIEQLQAQLSVLRTERTNLQQEAKFGEMIDAALGELNLEIATGEQQLTELQQRRIAEQQLTQQLLGGAVTSGADVAAGQVIAEQAMPSLVALRQQLDQLQQSEPLVHPWVDEQVIAEVLSDWTGIPSGRMMLNDLDNALNLEQLLGENIFGQQTAINEIAKAVRIARAGIQTHERPLGIFMLAGATGTGKTETAYALAEAMYGGVHNLITFNMSEFQEAHTISTLKGAPPGYVGYGKGGKLTEAVRRKPYSVLLLDEFDKAHPDIHEAFYQVFDKGWMEDSEGRMVSFRQCFILLTCNQGAQEIESACSGESEVTPAVLRPLVYDALQKVFSPALLARVNIIPYLPLDLSTLAQIADKHLLRLQQRLQQEIGVTLTLEGEIASWIADRVSTHPYRGRAIEELLRQSILPPIGNEVLRRRRDDQEMTSVRLLVEESGLNLDFA